MVTDDDAFVRVDKIVELLQDPSTPNTRYYAGQVLSTQFRRSIPPVRDAAGKNYLSLDRYSMSELPPFAIGPHYVLSSDLVGFLDRNRHDLRGVGTLEDVSVGFWLLALLQVHPVRLPLFNHLRFKLCSRDLISYVDVSQAAMRAMHTNLLHNTSLCTGFSFVGWAKKPSDPELPVLSVVGGDRQERELLFEWDLRWEPALRTIRVKARVSAKDVGEETSVTFTPATTSFIGACDQLHDMARRSMPTTILPEPVCADVRSGLARLLDEAVETSSGTSAIYELARTNINHGIYGSAVFVRVSPNAQRWRTFIEATMAGIFPDAHVFVMPDREYEAQFRHVDPDMVFTTPDEVPESYQTERAYPNWPMQSPLPRLIVLETARTTDSRQYQHRVICISTVTSATHQRQLYIPHASLAFVDTIAKSPMDLLHSPSQETTNERREGIAFIGCQRLGTVTSTAAHVFLRTLEAESAGMIDLATDCGNGTLLASQSTALFTLDNVVSQLRNFRFTLVFEDHFHMPGLISDRIVSAFLARTIPIYYGHSATVVTLFNPQAFIDCEHFLTIRACAEHVANVARTPVLFQNLQRHAPIVNSTAFSAAFSWHPAVAAATTESPRFTERLKEMLLDV